MKISEYGIKLVAPWAEKEAEDIRNRTWNGTEQYMEDIRSVQDAAGWCLLTYREHTLETIDEWVQFDGAVEVFGIPVEMLKAELEKCYVKERELTFEEKLNYAKARSEVDLNVSQIGYEDVGKNEIG